MVTIYFENLTVYTTIGAYTWEHEIQQKLHISLKIKYDSSHAIKTDNLEEALDYHALANDLIQFAATAHFQLLEAFAKAIVDRLCLNPRIQSIWLKVSKPQAIKEAEDVGVIIEIENQREC